MAEIGSPIAGGIRAVRNTVSSSVFSTTPSNRNNLNTSVITPLLVQNSQGLKGVSNDIGSLNQQVSALRNSLNAVKQNLELEASLTRQRESAAAAREEKLIALKLREGKESGFERKIQNALMAPVAKIGNQARGVLGRVGNIFKVLFFGWLGKSAIDAYQAISLRNIEKLKQIGIDVGKTLLTIGGLYLGSRLALRGTVGILARLATRSTKYTKGFGIWQPFKDIRTLIGIAANSLAAFAPLFWFGKNKGEGDKNWIQRKWSDLTGGNKDKEGEGGWSVDEITGEEVFVPSGEEAPGNSGDKWEKYSIQSMWKNLWGGNKKSDTKTENQSTSIKPKNQGLFGGLFARKPKPQQFDPYKEYNQGEFVSVRGQVSKIDEMGIPQPVDKSEFYNAQKEDTSENISASSKNKDISAIKRDPNTSSNLAALPQEEPVVVPVPQESGSGTTKKPSGGIFPGGGQSIPTIRPTDFNNNYVYHAYQQFNLSPVV
jgi:hypothetical protein